MPIVSGGNQITSTNQISDGVIVNADVKSDAAIDASKIANDVEMSGDQNIGGVKTFTSTPIVPDDAYSSSWNANNEVPTKNAVYDKIESLGGAPTFKNGTTTRAGNAASGSQTIAHGLGKTPSKVKITAIATDTLTGDYNKWSQGVYNGTTTSAVYMVIFNGTSTCGVDSTSGVVLNGNGQSQVATITCDSTNITLTWTKSGGGVNGTIQIMWEVE